MSVEKIKQSIDLIARVEQFLQDGLSENEAFNAALDEGDILEVKSLKDRNHIHKYQPSEVLYWVDRNAYLDELESWDGNRIRDSHSEALNYIESSKQESVIYDLIGLIRKNKVAPFLGAGVSASAGYPSWFQTLKELGERLENVNTDVVDDLLANSEYLEAAQLLFDVSESQLQNHIRTTFRTKADIEEDKNLIPEIIRLLPRLCTGAMITTNFDTLIEDWFKTNIAPEFDGILYGQQHNHNFVSKLLKGDRCLLKLHGDATQPISHVFTQNQYLASYGEDEIDFTRQLPKALRQIYVTNSLLFLGCSMQQDKTIELFEKVKSENQFVIPDHFALLSLPTQENESMIDEATKQTMEDRLYQIGIRPIWYPKADGHRMLTQLLKLVVDVSDSRLTLR